MKKFIFIALFICLTFLSISNVRCDDLPEKNDDGTIEIEWRKKYEDWCEKYEFDLKTDQQRFINFVKKCRWIEDHNSRFVKGQETFEMECNMYAHLTDDEMDEQVFTKDLDKAT
jgi:hypothetical protein